MELLESRIDARLDRMRALMVRPGAYYYTCIKRAGHFGREYPNYRIQIDPNVKQLILEYCDSQPGYFPQSIIDRFEEMEDGFGVRCFQAEEEEFFKEKDRDFLIMDPDLARYRKERNKKTILAKIAASQGQPISPLDAKIIADFESRHGDLFEFYQRRSPETLAQFKAEYEATMGTAKQGENS